MSVSSGEDENWPVTADWLHAILAKYHDSTVQVSDYRVSQSESALSDILFVRVNYTLQEEEVILDLVLKLLPKDPFSRFFVSEAQFDLREIKFYTKVAPDLHAFQKDYLRKGATDIILPIPKCFHARYCGLDEDPTESVLVLENLKSSGYDTVEFTEGLTLEQAKSAIAAVAKLHTLSLVMKVREGCPLSEKYPFLFQTARATDSYQQLVERGLPQLAEFLGNQPGMGPVLEALDLIKPDTKEIISGLLAPQEPLALITHTDFWCNNLLFREDDSCVILDWQMVTYSRPTNDLALLIVSSLPTATRRQHTSLLLEHYWTNLTEYCSQLDLDVEAELGYTRDNLDADFQRSKLLALLLCIGSVDVALGNPLTEQRLLDLLQDLHSEGLLTGDIIS